MHIYRWPPRGLVPRGATTDGLADNRRSAGTSPTAAIHLMHSMQQIWLPVTQSTGTSPAVPVMPPKRARSYSEELTRPRAGRQAQIGAVSEPCFRLLIDVRR